MTDESCDEVASLRAQLATVGDRVVHDLSALRHELGGDFERSIDRATSRVELGAELVNTRIVATVGEVRRDIEAGVEHLKQSLNVADVVRNRPVSAFAVAVAAGLLLSMQRGTRNPVRKPPAQASTVPTPGSRLGSFVASLLATFVFDIGRASATSIVESMARRKLH